MKILYVTTVSGTINAFLVPHIHMLLDAGHSVDMACNVNYPINETLLDRGCQVFQLEFQRSPLKKENYGAYRGLKKLIKNGEYDWVHTHTPVASALARLAVLKAGHCGRRLRNSRHCRASDSSERAAKSRPFSLDLTSSGRAQASAARTGKPLAMASRVAIDCSSA